MKEDLIRTVITKVTAELLQMGEQKGHAIPVGVSNRHVHLDQAHLDQLFPEGLTKWRDLSQPGQFAANESVILAGPKGTIEKVRVLGPARKKSQVEITVGDAYQLGIPAVVRESGKTERTPGITIIGARGSVQLQEGVIVAKRHLHMQPGDATMHQVSDGDTVQLRTQGLRSLVFDEVIVRVNPQYRLAFHIDFEEANAAGLSNGDSVWLTGSLPGPSLKRPEDHAEKVLDLITELDAKRADSTLYLRSGGLITPLARDVIRDRGIEVIIQNQS